MKLLLSQLGTKTKKFSVGAQESDWNIFASDWISPALKEMEISPQKFTAEISLTPNSTGEVSATFQFDTECALECLRCAGKFKEQFKHKYECLFVTENKGENEEERNIEELFTYDIPETLILPLEQFVLDALYDPLPERTLCKTECMGLCVECGANKNNELCKCATSPDATSVPFH